MPKKPQIMFPLDGDTVPVTNNPRTFIAQGSYKLDPGVFAVGVNGHLLAPGTNTVKEVGSLINWQRSGRRENVFFWSIQFELDAATVDGNYDLLVSAYLGSNAVKTATENNSSSRSDGIVLVTSAGIGINVTFPSANTNINGYMFMPYGSYTNNEKPDRATMTENSTGMTYTAGTIYGSGGNPNGHWYAAFSSLPNGTYTLDVLSGTSCKTVTGLKV